MRKLVYFVSCTLDGFIAGPDGGDPSSESYFSADQELIDFIVAEYPETLPGPARQAMGIVGPGTHFDTVLEGRGSYEIGLAAGLTDAYPHLHHLVFSTTMKDSQDPAVELVAADALGATRDLKTVDGLTDWTSGLSGVARLRMRCCPRSTVSWSSSTRR